jgi:hypothetical protein
MRRRLSITVSVCSALIIHASLLWPCGAQAEPPAVGAVEMPDTPAGRCAAAFFEMYKSGDEAAARAFEEKYRAKSALEQRSIDERLATLQQLRREWPRLAPQRVLSSAEHALALLVKAEPAGQFFQFQFDFEQQSPYGLIGIMIEGPVAPEAALEPVQKIDAEIRAATIDGVITALDEGYVFPEVAKKMAAALREHAAAGKYDDVTDAGFFALRLTEDLQAVCSDKHLRVDVGADSRRMREREDPQRSARENYGFVRAERMPGNVGYLKLNMFHPSKEAQEVAAAGLAFLANCQALIFDLRDNGGGSPEMIKFISSYLFDQPTHLNSFYYRPTDETTETWTLAEVPGKRFGEKLPVYVLTSHFTFSGAEEFTYNLKNLKRATIVGETTGGGAHPITVRPINDQFHLILPHGRAINPITKTNWEGVGVTPDIPIAADEALDVAHEHALKRIAEAS